MSKQFKVGDIVRVIDPNSYLSPMDKKVANRDAVVEWVGPDKHGQFDGYMGVRFLKRNGRGKEFTQRWPTRDFAKAKEPVREPAC